MSDKKLPDFIGVGASRSGTTTLWNCLKEHPQIFMPARKELHFFSRKANFDQGVEVYKSHFLEATEHQVKGEISPTYFYKGRTIDARGNIVYNEGDDCPIRIRKLIPNAKLIITLRNPLDRMYSQYAKRLLKGTESNPSFRSVVEEELKGKRKPKTHNGCYVNNSNYKVHIEKWLSVFPKTQCHFMTFEHWLARPEEEFRRLFKFLGVQDDFEIPTLKHTNKGRKSSNQTLTKKLALMLPAKLKSGFYRLTTQPLEPLSAIDRTFINEIMEPSILELEELLQMDFDLWRNR